MAYTNALFGTSAADAPTYSGWNLVSASCSAASERATSRDVDGNFSGAQTHNTTAEYTAEYEAVIGGTPVIPAALGAIVATDYVLTSIRISTGMPAKMTLTYHAHGSPVTTHQTCCTYTHGIAAPDAFGHACFAGGTAGVSGSACKGSEITISCEHADEWNADGTAVVGSENYGGKIEGKTTWAGTPATQAEAGWDVTGVETPFAAAWIETTVSFAKNLTRDE